MDSDVEITKGIPFHWGIIVTAILLVGVVAWTFVENPDALNFGFGGASPTDTAKILPEQQTSSTSDAAPGASQRISVTSAPADGDKNVIAQSVVTIGENRTFQLEDYPDVEFSLKRVALATGGVAIPMCGSEATFMSVKFAPPASPPGNCVNAVDYNEISPPALLYVGFELANNSAEYVGGDFVLALYSVTINGKQVIRKAQLDPPWGGFGADAFSARTLPMGFIIPADQQEVRIIFGNYADKYGKHYSNNDFTRTEGGFVVNFKNKTITELDASSAKSL
jgi:hypothetical protein